MPKSQMRRMGVMAAIPQHTGLGGLGFLSGLRQNNPSRIDETNFVVRSASIPRFLSKQM